MRRISSVRTVLIGEYGRQLRTNRTDENHGLHLFALGEENALGSQQRF
jgi:hypothetical protein